MSKRTLLLLIAAAIIAFTALSLKNRLAQTPPAEPMTQNPRVLIAKHDLAPGSFIQAAQDLDWAPAPAAPPPTPVNPDNPDNTQNPPPPVDTYLFENSVKITDFNGAVVRRQLHEGDPIPATALMKAGAGGLMSAVLNPGMRAVSISVAPNTNGAPFVSGFVLPGDYVDLIITRELNRTITNGREQEARKIVYSKIFVQNVRVLAADQMLDNPDNKAIVAKTITVEVTPTQAQEIAVAAELGKISVSLRSAVKDETAEKNNAVPSQNVSGEEVAGEDQKTPDVSEQVKMFRPKETQNLEFYKTHGD